MKLNNILDILESIAPFSDAEPWDNVGLLAGDPDQDIKSILITLDPGFDAIRHCVDNNIDLIITHHPLLIEPVKAFNLKEPLTRKLQMLFTKGISLVSMHTNLDKSDEGVADIFARCLNLKNIEKHGFVRTGTVDPSSLEDWVNTLPFKSARIVDTGSGVRHVAACPGSGMSLWREAFALGCDTIATGDVKYNIAIEAFESGLNVVDLGHYATEAIVLEPLAQKLGGILKSVEISVFTGEDVFISIQR